MPRGGLLDRVVFRVWESVQKSASQEEHELGSITLRLLGLLRRGEAATLDVACSEAFGCHFHVWCQRNMERTARMAWELSHLIPDYDPTATTSYPPIERSMPRLPPTEITQSKPLRETSQTKRPTAKRVS